MTSNAGMQAACHPDATQELLQQYLRTNTALRDACGLKPTDDCLLTYVAEGEYNVNHLFTNPHTQKRYLLRANKGSQLHLEQQITYESRTLQILDDCARTPSIYYVDDTKSVLPYGVSVMDYLDGRPLDYSSDLPEAARILADIHAQELPATHHLITPANPLAGIYEECAAMFARYQASAHADQTVVARLEQFFSHIRTLIDKQDAHPNPTPVRRCVVNTELNSHNFLIRNTAPGYLIDWEKPLASVPEQDLAHFLVPTTTFWKTDHVLSQTDCQEFVALYESAVQGRFPTPDLWHHLTPYLTTTCLRGITWCAMAYGDHCDGIRALSNDFTYHKVQEYLTPDFLDYVWDNYYTS